MADNAARAGARPARRSRRDDDPRMIGNWKIGRTIGKGSSGRVKIARHVRTGQYAAIKIVSKHALVTSRMSMTDAADTADKILLGIEREIVIMKLIDHPNILRLYDVWETSNELYLVMEYVEGGELFDYLVSRGRLPVEEALHYFQQIIFAVDYCHRFNIAHRDLKPENLLLDKSRNIKVADFGMAAWEGGVGLLETSCGSPHYASPEVVEGKSYHGSTSDIWSCGVILFALLAGRLPFDDENIRHLLEKVKIARYVMPSDIDPAARDLLSRMLQKDVEKRITMPEIMQHPWFTSKPPRPVAGVMPPPALDEVACPIKSRDDIDADIFRNLRTLWHGAPEDEIVEGLTNSEKTWEKAVYHLLLKYRTRRLENYNMGEEEDESMGRASNPSAAKQRIRPTVAPASRKSPPAPETDTVISSPPARPDPPTPRKAMGRSTTAARSESPAPTSIIVQRPSSTPRPESPTRPTRPVGPRPQVTTSAIVGESISTAPNSPTKAERDSRMSAPTSTAPTSPTTTTTSYLSAGAPVLDMPELQDESVQRFFRQIVEHLGTMQMRQSLVVPTVVVPPGSEQPKIVLAPVATSPPPPTPESATFDEADSSRFADADDDDTETATTASNAGASSIRAVTPQLTGTRATPGLGYTSVLPAPSRGMAAHLHATRDAPPRPPMALRKMRSEADADKENGGRMSMLSPRPMSIPPRSVGENRANGGVLERRKTDGGKHVQIVLPREAPKVLKKKKSMTVDASPALSDGSFSTYEESTPKRSWFNNLFKFKPASYILLSVFDSAVTSQECARLLAAMGVHVSALTGDTLKCRMDEIRDPSGSMAVTKAVRFRVELHQVGASTAHAMAGYLTSMILVQEKGALSSFKSVYNRLRREWDLDDMPQTPVSAMMSGTPASETASSFQFV